MNSPIRTQKKIFIPTTARQEPQCCLWQFIDNGEFMIIHRSSVKRIYNNIAEVMVCGRRLEAKIEYQGTQEECQRACEQAETRDLNDDEDRENTETDDVEDDEIENIGNDLLNTSSISINKTTMPPYTPQQKRKQSELGSATDIHLLSTTSNSMKRTKNTSHLSNQFDLSSAIDDDKEIQSMTSSYSALMKHIDSRFDAMENENKKQHVKLLKQMDAKHAQSFDLAAYRESGLSEQLDDVIHGNVNLTLIRGKSIGDYARQVLRILFSEEELISSILPPGGPQYSRKALDSQRFQRVHDALRSKYKITLYLYDEFYQKLVRPNLSDFLINERKRAHRKNL